MLHTTVPVAREVKAQRRAAFHAPTKTALLIAVAVVVFATKLPANALALLSQDNTSMVLHAKQHAGQIHTLQTGIKRDGAGDALYNLAFGKCARPCEGGQADRRNLKLEHCYHENWWKKFDFKGGK